MIFEGVTEVMDTVRHIGIELFALLDGVKFFLIGSIVYVSVLLSEKKKDRTEKIKNSIFEHHDSFLVCPSLLLIVIFLVGSMTWVAIFLSGWIIVFLYILFTGLLFWGRSSVLPQVKKNLLKNSVSRKFVSSPTFRLRGIVVAYLAGLFVLNIWVNLALENAYMPQIDEWIVVSCLVLPLLLSANALLFFPPDGDLDCI